MADPGAGSHPARDLALEDIVAAFFLEREEGRNPSVDDYLARHPKHAEELARLLSYEIHPTFRFAPVGTPETHPPARRTTSSKPSDVARIGPYEILEHVSSAGGGTVYRARHAEAGHVVALKVLDTRGAVDPRDIERFRREAAMLRALDLVHVVPVLETGEDAGRFWIAMKWLEGDTLGSLREAVSAESHPLRDHGERARLIARVARTFAAIHGCGILHRDVKPTNIMVDRTGEPMIIDFGIAQAPDLPELTATTDQLMGTPRYLAPELLAGGNREVSPRTDVYGLGLCLYELCTGAEAFKHELRADLFSAIRTTGPMHPTKENPAIPGDLAAVILRALEIDPARRYPDMKAFADDLDRVARGDSPEPTTLRGANPVLRTIRRKKKALIAAACLALVVVPATWLSVSRALDGTAAREREAILRPFAWFSPEAFAGGVGLPSKEVAGELAENDTATAEQRLLAAWLPFLSGDVKGAHAHVGAGPRPGEGFATKLFREHLFDLKNAQSQGHAPIKLLMDQRTAEYDALVPIDNPSEALTRDPARFDASVTRLSAESPPSTPLDHLVLATLSWTLVSNAPDVDSATRRAAIESALAHAIDAGQTRAAALHLRGVMRFLAGDLPAARRDLESVVEAQPRAVGSRYLLGIACTRSGDPKRGCELLEAVARELPASHAGYGQMLGHLAIARAAAGRLADGIAACERWWTDGAMDGKWQTAVIPRVLAAHLYRERGDLLAARELLVTAIQEEERIKLAIQEREERGSGEPPDPIALWEPAFRDLRAVAEALQDQETIDECQAKRATVRLIPMPETAEAYLDVNLGGLRLPDTNRRFTLAGRAVK